MRSGMRALVARFTEIGIPASRVALELQFQSAPGTGGREGLQPRCEVARDREAAGARRPAGDEGAADALDLVVGLGDVQHGRDRPDKGEAVCVYLWARDQKLCSGPGAAGPAMDASLTVGQLDQLRPAWSASCLPGRSARARSRRSHGRSATADIAASVVLERLVLQQEVKLDAHAVLAAELAFVDDHFRGSVPAYLAALRRIRLTRTAARGLLLDELRRDAVRAASGRRAPSAAAIAEFHVTYAGLQARLVETDAARRLARLPDPRASPSRRSPRRGSSRCRAAARVRTIHGRIAGQAARRHRLPRHRPIGGGAAGDRVVAEPLRPRLGLRELAREGAGTGARPGDLHRRQAPVAGRA